MKNPGVFTSRVLLNLFSYSLCVTCTFNRPWHPWNTIHATIGVWPGKCCLEHRGFCRQWTECCFHHKSYCTVFSNCCQPLNDFFFQSYLCLAAELVAEAGFEPAFLGLWDQADRPLPYTASLSYSYLSGVPSRIQTYESTALQAEPLSHSGIGTLICKHTIRWPIIHRNSFSQDNVFAYKLADWEYILT